MNDTKWQFQLQLLNEQITPEMISKDSNCICSHKLWVKFVFCLFVCLTVDVVVISAVFRPSGKLWRSVIMSGHWMTLMVACLDHCITRLICTRISCLNIVTASPVCDSKLFYMLWYCYVTHNRSLTVWWIAQNIGHAFAPNCNCFTWS